MALWLFVLIGAATSGLDPIEPAFLAFVAIGVGAHVLGMLLARYMAMWLSLRVRIAQFARVPVACALVRQRRSRRATKVLLLVLAAAVMYFIAAYSEVVPTLDASGFLAARNAYLEEVRGLRDKQFLYTTHLTLVGIAAMFFSARAFHDDRLARLRANRAQLNIAAAMTFALALLTTGRTAPLLVILAYSFFCLRFGIYRKTTIVVAFITLSLTMFIVVAFALGKEGLGDGGEVDAAEALASLGRIYFFSAPVALQAVVMQGADVSNACSNILSYPLDLARKFGFFAHCDVRELDFVFVPVATNVFTFLRAYWEDFGLAFPAALLVSGFIIECVHQSAWRRAGLCTFLFPFVLNSVLLQVFEEQLFANGSVFAYLLLAFLLCSWFYRLPKPRQKAAMGTAAHVGGTTVAVA